MDINFFYSLIKKKWLIIVALCIELLMLTLWTGLTRNHYLFEIFTISRKQWEALFMNHVTSYSTSEGRYYLNRFQIYVYLWWEARRSLEILIWISGVFFWREKWWLLTDDLTNDQDFALLAYWPPLPPAKDGGWVTRVGWWLGAIFVWLKPGTGPYWVAGKKP